MSWNGGPQLGMGEPQPGQWEIHLVSKWEMDIDLVASVGKGALQGVEIDKVILTDIII